MKIADPFNDAIQRLCFVCLANFITVLPLQSFAASSLDRQCASEKQPNASELQSLLAEISMVDLQLRSKVLSLMHDPKNGCRKALELRLAEVKEKPANFQSNTGRHSALTLGLLLQIPAAMQIVESEAAGSAAPEWLAMLQQWDEKAYEQLLHKWIKAAAEKIRSDSNLGLVEQEFYGKMTIAERAGVAQKANLTPLVLDLYLKNLSSRTPSAEEFLTLNVLYASTQPGSRRLIRDSFSVLLKKNVLDWIKAFRVESAWTQFQIMELMGLVGGSEMVKELLWISQNHIDPRMKSRASQALDEALKPR